MFYGPCLQIRDLGPQAKTRCTVRVSNMLGGLLRLHQKYEVGVSGVGSNQIALWVDNCIKREWLLVGLQVLLRLSSP